MKLEEARRRLNDLSEIRFEWLFSDEEINKIIINKGKTGQLLELALGMRLSNTNRDFEDGELKTNKCDAQGKPLETVFITQISSIIDDLILQRPFEDSHLYEKISNMLYVPVCKQGHPNEWMFLPSIHVDLTLERFEQLETIWRDDYYSICEQLKTYIKTSRDKFIHTSNGRHIQVRSKDSKPYHPIYSKIYQRNVSNKNHAFYFQKQFVYDIRQLDNL